MPPRRIVWILLMALALGWLSLTPVRERTVLVGRPGDAQALGGFSLPSDHLGARGRWTRGQGTIAFAPHPGPVTVRLRVASAGGEARPLDVTVAGVDVTKHAAGPGWTDIEVAVHPRLAARGFTLELRSPVTQEPGGVPQGIFVERAVVRTGGPTAPGRTRIAALIGLPALFLMTIAFAGLLTHAPPDAGEIPGPRRSRVSVSVAFVALVFVGLVAFRQELLARLGPLVAFAAVALGGLALAVHPRTAARLAALSPRHSLAAFAVLAAGLVALLFPATLLDGYVLSQADMLYQHFPWRAYLPEGYRAPDRPPLGDIPMLVYPFAVFATTRWWEGVFPVWTTAMNSGQPFLATYQSALFSPFTYIAAVVPLPQATVILAAARLLTGGTGMFLFLRALGLSRWAACTGGVAYLLNPFSIVWLEHPPINVPPWLPWMLLAGERVAASAAAPRALLFLALTTAVTLAGGHPHTGFFVVLMGGGYALVRALASGSPLRTGLLAGAALATGVALTAVQVVPFLEYLSLSRGATTRGSYGLNPFITPASTLITAVVPNFLGHPNAGNFAGPTNYLEQQAYPGLATWLLAVIGIPWGRRRLDVWFFTAAAALTLLVIYGAPGVHQIVSSIPLVNAASLPRAGIVALASLAILAAFGADDILRAGRHARWQAVTVAGTALILIGLAVASWYARQPLLAAQGLSEFAGRWVGVAAWLAAAVSLLAIARVHGAISRAAAGFALAAVMALDLLLFGHGFHPLTRPDQVFPVLPEIQRVREDPGLFRVMGLGSALLPNTAMAYGLQDVRAYDGLGVARYADLLDAVLLNQGYSHLAVGLHSPLINLLNVKYVFGTPGTPVPAGWFTKLTDGEAPLYRNERVLPRAFLVDAYVVRNDDPARRTLRDGLIDFQRVALLEQELPHGLRPAPAVSPDAVGAATVKHYRDHLVAIETDAPDQRLLVLTDVHYPGWRAAVDGQPAALVRANFAFRAVPVPAGRHTVTFEYKPASLRLGLAISAAALAALAGLALYARPRRAGDPRR